LETVAIGTIADLAAVTFLIGSAVVIGPVIAGAMLLFL